MGKLPRPDVPPGPRRELVDALHDLHHRAGWPSLRALAGQAGCSPTTVSAVFSSPRLPSWGILEVLVEAMDGDVRGFKDLWLDASSPDGTPPPGPRIAGRKQELVAVRRHFETGSGLLLVAGEAGIGKTTLVNAAASAVDGFVAVGRCLPLSAQVPLLPVVNMLRATIETDDGRRMKAALAGCPANIAGTLAGLLPEIGADSTDDPAEEWAHQRQLTALRSVLAALGSLGPFALLVEDLHWADASTLELLEHLVTTRADVVIVGTWRLHDPATDRINVEWFRRVCRTARPEPVLLAPLTREETAEQLSAQQEIAVDVDAVYARSLGHPLFTAQLAAHRAAGPMPALLGDLLDARLGDLDGNTWALARILGVADRPLSAELLGVATGLAHDSVVEGLRVLAERRLLAPTQDGRSASLGHPLLAEAVRRRLVPGEGPETHRRIAEALASRDDAEPAEVAAHWQQAGHPREELRWRVRAAGDALDRVAARQEADHWLRALELWPTDVEPDVDLTRSEVARAAMTALELSGREDDALALARQTLHTSPELTPSQRFDITAYAAGVMWGQEGPEVALETLDQAVADHGSDVSEDEVVRTLPMRANLLAAGQRYDESLPCLEVALDYATQVEDAALTGRVAAAMIWHQSVAGDLAQALHWVDVARAALVGEAHPGREIFLAMMHTDALLIHARPVHEVESAARRALRLIDDLGLIHTQANMVRANLAEALLRAGQVREAYNLLPRELRISTDFSCWPIHFIAAKVNVALGDFESAWPLLDLPHQADALAAFEHVAPSCEARLWTRQPRGALEGILPLLQEVTDSQAVRFAALPFVLGARAAADLVDAEGAGREQWHQRLTTLRRSAVEDPLGPGHVPGHRAAAIAAWHAELSRLAGTATVDHWIRAAKEWDVVARPHDAAYARWRGAEIAIADGHATLATKLLRRAAKDADQHVPLSGAIAATSRGTP